MTGLGLVGSIVLGALGGAVQMGTGGATVTGDPGQCASAISVQLWTLTRSRFSPRVVPTDRYVLWTGLSPTGGPLSVAVSFVTAQMAEGRCEWTFRALPAGEYVALIVTPDGSGGSQPFSVSSGAMAAVAIPGPKVTLSGQVLRDGVPARTHLKVTSFPFARPDVVVVTDADGRYRVTLDRPGLHRIEAVSVGIVESELADGPNAVNINAGDRPAPQSHEPRPPQPPPPPPGLR
jgi:hypothetical protein